MEGRRLLACSKCLICPHETGLGLFQHLLWKEVKRLCDDGKADSGVLLSVPNNVPRPFVETQMDTLKWIGRDEILIQQFKVQVRMDRRVKA